MVNSVPVPDHPATPGAHLSVNNLAVADKPDHRHFWFYSKIRILISMEIN